MSLADPRPRRRRAAGGVPQRGPEPGSDIFFGPRILTESPKFLRVGLFAGLRGGRLVCRLTGCLPELFAAGLALRWRSAVLGAGPPYCAAGWAQKTPPVVLAGSLVPGSSGAYWRGVSWQCVRFSWAGMRGLGCGW